MSVYYKLKAVNGVVTESSRHKICWGFLKSSLQERAEAYLKELNDLPNLYKCYLKDMKEHYGSSGTIMSMPDWSRSTKENYGTVFGLPTEAAATGIAEVIVCSLFDRGRNSVSCNETAYDAFTVLLMAYPKLFECITKVDKEAGEVTINYDYHYAVIYNVLRIVGGFMCMPLDVSQSIIDNQDLSLFIADMYKDGSLSIGEGQVFTVCDARAPTIKDMIERREWYLSDDDRDDPVNSAMVRGDCSKNHMTSYVELVDPNTKRYRSLGNSGRTLLNRSLSTFIINMKGVAHAAA